MDKTNKEVLSDKANFLSENNFDVDSSLKDFEATLSLLRRQYLLDKNFKVLPFENKEVSFNTSLRFLHLNKFVYEKNLKITDKLLSVYSALYSTGTTFIVKLVSDGTQCDFYIGIKKENDAAKSLKILKGAMEGNFPGTTFTKDSLPNSELINLNADVFSNTNEISCALGVASLKNKQEDEFVQGIENLVIAMQGKEFSALFVAAPIASHQIEEAKNFYEHIYTQLHPLKEQTINLSTNESVAVTKGITNTVGSSFTKSKSKTKTNSIAKGTNTTQTENSNPWVGKKIENFVFGTNSQISTENAIQTLQMPIKASVSVADKLVDGKIKSALDKVDEITDAFIKAIKNKSEELDLPDIKGDQLLNTKATSKAEGMSKTKTKSNADTEGTAVSENESKAIAESESKNSGNSKSCQFVTQDKKIANILERLDVQFDRIKKGESLGLWNVGAYFMSKEQQNSVVAANIYSGLIKGNDTGVEKSVVHTFAARDSDSNYNNILKSLKQYELPTIKVEISNSENIIKLATITNTAELCIQASMPHKAFVGLDVVETAPFGNNVKHTGSNTISIGHLYNYEKEFPLAFTLDIEKFTGHIFVTGSTGSGKSNVTYNLIDNLIKKDIKFMVIEPAKGEYKHIFGNRIDVEVYGTNKAHSKVLKINPFTFPKEIHIYEHIDRLIEILNASWPMYAAMPAILKEAVEEAYKSKGWDLKNSINLTGTAIYPTFQDLGNVLPNLIANSGYSQEMISNYSGALVTRVKSMTNGIFELIFTDDEISSEKLFNENTIIDLSRVASAETKSLIMGIVFMKLQEYRMCEPIDANAKLRHVAVIEEAHNLLKNTSSEQGQESANLQGKSVEMISNAIAEMRTYGQGFILADQAPGLLDPSAIRNTNTKICLRLPSQDDRELVGKAMNLDDDQINELARLKTGVAAIYQNDWQESVLCKFNFYESKESSFVFKSNENFKIKITKFLANQLAASYKGDSINKKKLDKTERYKEYHKVSNRILNATLTSSFIENELCSLLEVNEVIELTTAIHKMEAVSFYKALLTYKKILSNKWGFDIKSEYFITIVGLTLTGIARKNDLYLPILNAYLSDIKNRNLKNRL
ncbi:ATP-binding protein [Algibacter sp. L1A34]|uniref:ATP-binding protein n=1 Tax=Algibacter sp. L1A34 TaxID=2686365 RepID=UPI00131A8687|nr:ATP-binding protein [Algibacter sp. L1A34]